MFTGNGVFCTYVSMFFKTVARQHDVIPWFFSPGHQESALMVTTAHKEQLIQLAVQLAPTTI